MNACLSDLAQRRARVEDEGTTVRSLWDPAEPLRAVDVLVVPPIPYQQLRQRAVMVTLPDGPVPVASTDDLIGMERLAGHPEDHLDIEALTALHEERDGG